MIAASTTCLGGDGCSEDRIALWEKVRPPAPAAHPACCHGRMNRVTVGLSFSVLLIQWITESKPRVPCRCFGSPSLVAALAKAAYRHSSSSSSSTLSLFPALKFRYSCSISAYSNPAALLRLSGLWSPLSSYGESPSSSPTWWAFGLYPVVGISMKTFRGKSI